MGDLMRHIFLSILVIASATFANAQPRPENVNAMQALQCLADQDVSATSDRKRSLAAAKRQAWQRWELRVSNQYRLGGGPDFLWRYVRTTRMTNARFDCERGRGLRPYTCTARARPCRRAGDWGGNLCQLHEGPPRRLTRDFYEDGADSCAIYIEPNERKGPLRVETTSGWIESPDVCPIGFRQVVYPGSQDICFTTNSSGDWIKP